MISKVISEIKKQLVLHKYIYVLCKFAGSKSCSNDVFVVPVTFVTGTPYIQHVDIRKTARKHNVFMVSSISRINNYITVYFLTSVKTLNLVN